MLIILPFIILLVPFVGLPIVLFDFIDSSKFRIISLISLSLFFAVMGYYFVPNVGTDLSRYFTNYVDYYRNFSSSIFWKQIILSNPFFIVQDMLFFVSSRFNIDQVLPFFTMFLVYGNGFFIIKWYSMINNLRRSIVLKMVLIFITIAPFSTLVNNIRNILAVSIISLAIFLDMYLKKRNMYVLLLYLIGASVHIAVIPVIVLRFFIGFLFSILHINFKLMALNLSFLVISTYVIVKFGLIETLLSKANSYLSGGEGTELGEWFSAADSSGIQSVNKYSAFVMLLLITITLVLFIINKEEKTSSTFFSNELNVLLIGVFCGVFFLIFRPGTTWFRYYMVFLFFIPLLFVQILKLKEKLFKNMLLFSLFFYCLLMFIVQIYVLQSQTNIGTFVTNILGSPIWGFFKLRFIS